MPKEGGRIHLHLIKRSKPPFGVVDLKVLLHFRLHRGNAVELALVIGLLNLGLINCHITFQLGLFFCKCFLHFLKLFLQSFLSVMALVFSSTSALSFSDLETLFITSEIFFKRSLLSVCSSSALALTARNLSSTIAEH